jgi:hypothetical protein
MSFSPAPEERNGLYDQSLDDVSRTAPRAARKPGRPAPMRTQRVQEVRRGGGILVAAERASWVAGLVLAVSPFMAWYSGSSVEGPPLAVIGWHTGTLGKLVLFVGLGVLLVALLDAVGVHLPSTLPASLLTTGLGALATIFVLIRIISIPQTFAGTAGRSVGIWISLIAALAVVAAGLLRTSEEL